MTDFEFYFQVCLRSLIIRDQKDNELIKSYSLNEPNERIKNELVAKVTAAMASPEETGVYQAEMEERHSSEVIALQAVNLNGLIALAFLGEKEIIPTLLAHLRKDKTQNIKRRVVANMALCYLTEQPVSRSFLFDKDLDFWEEWWRRNRNKFAKK